MGQVSTPSLFIDIATTGDDDFAFPGPLTPAVFECPHHKLAGCICVRLSQQQHGHEAMRFRREIRTPVQC